MPSEPAAFRSRPARRAARWLILSIVLLVLLRGWGLQGCLRPIRVAGNSMAESLRGPHCPAQCLDCRFSFYCAAEFVPSDARVVCPNCGFPDNPIDPQRVASGRRVLIDRWDRWRCGPQLWQAVAFETGAEQPELTVKRIVAVGDTPFGIRHGDIFVDGTIQRKTLEQLRSLRILVHDDRFRPTRTPGLPARWQPARADSHWRAAPVGHDRFGPVDENELEIDWLEYVQWPCWKHADRALLRTNPVPILDHYGCNQSLSRGALSRVTDVMVSFQLRTRGRGAVHVRLGDRHSLFQLAIYPTGQRAELWRDGALVAERRGYFPEPWLVEMALCDRQVLAAINGSALLCYPYQARDVAHAAATDVSPLPAVGVRGLAVECRSLRVFRDVHYLGPGGLATWDAPPAAVPNGWFVVGDNVPASLDSRWFSSIESSRIRGPVVPLGRSGR
jgi:type IV secretory pathway protease TraF